MEVSLPPFSLRLIIAKLPNGGKLYLTLNPDDIILTVKSKIETQGGIPVKDQSLVFLGKPLEDGLSLKDYAISYGKTIYVYKKENTFSLIPSLAECCMVEVVKHLEDYSMQELSALPTSLRQDLLIHFPVADLYKYEDTSITKGVNMEEVWYAKCLLTVRFDAGGNVESIMPAKCVEHVSRQKWAPGPFIRILLKNHNKRLWRNYYFDCVYDKLFGASNPIDRAELFQALFYVPKNYKYCRYLIIYGQEDDRLPYSGTLERVEFLFKGFFIPPRYQMYKPYRIDKDELTQIFYRFTKRGPRSFEVPMLSTEYKKWIIGPDKTLALSNLQILVYEVWLQCRIPEKQVFLRHLEAISSVQSGDPIFHTLKIIDNTAEPDDQRGGFSRHRDEKIEPAMLTKATLTSAYMNLERLLIGGSVIEPYIEHLLPAIENQPMLHSLELIFATWKERFVIPEKALKSLSAFLKRPTFQLLGLGGFKIPASFFCAFVQEFLLNSVTKPSTLYICESEILNADATTDADVPGPEDHTDSDVVFAPKSLAIKHMATLCPTLGSKYILPALRNTLANLKVLDVSCCGFSDAEELLAMLVYHSNLHIEVLDISSNGIPETEESCKLLEALFQNLPSLQVFRASNCGLGSQPLLTSFIKGLVDNASKIGVRFLSLARNELSKCSKETLLSFFSALCHLPHLSEVSLSYNGLLPEHAELFREAWNRSGRTKFSVVSWRVVPPPTVIQTWPPIDEAQELKLNRSILCDICWDSLL